MVMIQLPPDFREFLKLLNEHKVKYLLIGGYAVSYYGYPRSTADMDIWVAIEPKNADNLVAVLREFGFDVPSLESSLFLNEDKVIRMGLPPLRIELLTTISGVNFDECYSERVVSIIDGVEVNIISLKHLKINKKASGRYKDLDDLDHLGS
jgi:predicted nucleotidyltransferase